MARIPYIEEGGHPELAAEIGRIKGGRGTLLNIYKLLLHSPGVAMSWLEHASAIRWKTALTGRLRELVIIRTALTLDYAYALQQHVPAMALAEGVSAEECEALEDWRSSAFFDERERAALAYADAMVAAPEVPRAVFDAARVHFSHRELLEVSVLVGTYMMHNRVFTALGVDLESHADKT